MVEVKKNWHRQKTFWKAREKQRFNDQVDTFTNSDLVSTSTKDEESNLLLHDLTKTIRTKLTGVGIIEDGILNQANIYEQAIGSLRLILKHTPLSQSLSDSSNSELDLLVKSLLKLFTGNVTLRVTKNLPDRITVVGYTDIDEQTLRIVAYQKLRPSYSELARKVTHAQCQIYIKEILGRSGRGKAIAGSDARIRCGLRSGGWMTNSSCTVSIDSGIPVQEAHDVYFRYSGAITQAYNESRKHPESFYYLQDADAPNTFHYSALGIGGIDPKVTAGNFRELNQSLNLIFKQIAKYS